MDRVLYQGKWMTPEAAHERAAAHMRIVDRLYEARAARGDLVGARQALDSSRLDLMMKPRDRIRLKRSR